jgi:hypothetical protein
MLVLLVAGMLLLVGAGIRLVVDMRDQLALSRLLCSLKVQDMPIFDQRDPRVASNLGEVGEVEEGQQWCRIAGLVGECCIVGGRCCIEVEVVHILVAAIVGNHIAVARNLQEGGINNLNESNQEQ